MNASLPTTTAYALKGVLVIVSNLLKMKTTCLGLAAIVLFGISSASADRPPAVAKQLQERAVKQLRAARVVPTGLAARAASQPDSRIKVWVFFTDKGVFDQAGFASAAAAVKLTERALQRRAKVNRDRVVFADLPVASGYVEQIKSLGAGHRRSSRWLNAASFELPARLLTPISRLPFVAEIRPLAFYSHGPEPEEASRLDQPGPSLVEPNALDYGASFYQLEQITVPAVHDMGYSGQGVTLALLDTGFKKTHESLAPQVAAGRLLAEYDFVYGDSSTSYDGKEGEWLSETNHGTRVWSVAGGLADGFLYGPAYLANFILCKTEDIRSETPVEEDNWVAALEYVDSIGTDVISTSLGYSVFDDSVSAYNYTVEDLDGKTATISIAASTCDGLGIVMINSAGNSGGLGASSITPPADAFDILAVGSVDINGVIAGSSSRGPTYDGRIKPEVCARGVSTLCAHYSVDNAYGNYSGTSFAAPLVAGAACLLIEAHPDWTPHQVRQALMLSASNAATPDNSYGWGIIDTYAAIQMTPKCCAYRVGDANQSGGDEPTLGDVALLIDAKFITSSCDGILNCLTEADINQSGGLNPTCDDISVGDVSRLVDYLFITGVSLGLPDCL